MKFSLGARLGLFAVLTFSNSFTMRSSASELPRVSWLRLPSLESPVATINLRKLARKVLHWGEPGADNLPLWLGPARARLLWQKTWRWPDSGKDHKLPGGLLGGPVISIDMPLDPINKMLSLETRLCSSRYAYPDRGSSRILLEELADPRSERQSFEAGLYLNIAFDRLF